ncbi:MAG: ABC-type multidrug transport system fused ATPase/permease subunit, partial [Candidatus Marinamargulisbacteria bacterium]
SPMQGTVTFENVSFYYDKENGRVLKNVNLEVKEGEIIALVGLSGAGKSTLVHLVSRFYDPTKGRIVIDGIDLKEIELDSLRSQMGLVPQEDILFRGTVHDNIKYGRKDATAKEIEAAAKAANAWEFIVKMKGKMRAKVGDRGNRLSGGQKQRISIARAILRNPRILILDEATSALDSKSEALVQDALKKLMEGRTTFVIAHRLSTIMHAHKIVVVDDGEIKEIGTHEELIKKAGIYKGLYEIQFKKATVTDTQTAT